MAKVTPTSSTRTPRKRRPAINSEDREKQLIALAVDLVEQRLLDGTASSQETTHFLKLATTKAKYENDLLEAQVSLAQAKKEAIQSQKRSEELFLKAMKAFRTYSGQSDPDSGDDDDY